MPDRIDDTWESLTGPESTAAAGAHWQTTSCVRCLRIHLRFKEPEPKELKVSLQGISVAVSSKLSKEYESRFLQDSGLSGITRYDTNHLAGGLSHLFVSALLPRYNKVTRYNSLKQESYSGQM